jgi:hypothetical protein
MKKLTLFLIVFQSINVFGQIGLFTEERISTQKEVENFLNKDELSHFTVDLNIDSLKPEDYKFKLEGKTIILKNKNFRINDIGYRVWSSEQNMDGVLRGLIINKGNSFNGYIVTKDYLYKIRPIQGKRHIVTKHLHNFPTNECDTPIDTLKTESQALKSTSATVSSSCSTNEIYRIAIAYTPEFKATFSSQALLNDFLILVIEYTNETYINSNINVRARLAFAYQTPDSERGNKDLDFSDLVHKHNPRYPTYKKFDEIFDYIDDYNADVGILLVAANIGGRAQRNDRLAIYGKNGAGWNYGVAHEIGHMFNLEHNREEFNAVERLFLDGKKAYGFQGTNDKTVMSYGGQTRVSLYSDEGYTFSSGETAGDEYSHARNYINNNKNKVIVKSDKTDINLNNETINSDEMVSFYARNNLQATNYVCKNESNVSFKAGNSITLQPGFKVEKGASFSAFIIDCDNSFGFKSAEVSDSPEAYNRDIESSNEINNLNSEIIKLYPNPTEDLLNIVIDDDLQVSSIFLINSSGKTVLTKNIFNTIGFLNINTSNLVAGIYILKINTNKGVFEDKIIKQ